MHKTKNDARKRYAFKIRIMRELIESKQYSRTTMPAIFHFIDYLLRLPNELAKKLATSIRIEITKEGSQMLQAKREDLSPTLAEIMRLERKEGREEGREKTKIHTAKKMLQINLDIEQIILVTGLTKEEVIKLKESKFDNENIYVDLDR